MTLINSLKDLTTNKAERLSELTRKIINICGLFIGIRKKDNKYDFHRFTSTAWIFLVGIPLGLVFLGNSFSISIWAIIVGIITIFCNLDYVFNSSKANKCSTGYSYT